MKRREFTRLGGLGAVGLWLGGAEGVVPRFSGSTNEMIEGVDLQPLEVDSRRLGDGMRTLAGFGANDEGGIDRVAFSDANVAALEWIEALLTEAGFSVERDLVGNLVARKAGSVDGLPPIVFGSHADSVPGGGNYDGQVGVMGSVEVATVLADARHTTRHPLEVVVFTNEEGGKTGSRALVGEVEPFELDIETASGLTIGEGIRRLGGDPDRLDEARRGEGSMAAFLELHVEQGAVLDQDGIDIGVVEGIVGIMRWNVVAEGMTNHAGTTPMDRRTDALVGSARFIEAVYRTALEMPGRQVATIGIIEPEPGAPNVIAGRVRMTLEIRDLSMDGIGAVFDAVQEQAAAIETDTGVAFSFERFYTSRAAPTDPRLRDMIEDSATELGLSSQRMPSGAGHDAQSMALIGPVGMIFVPSVDGISHAPEERTELADVVNGSNVLLRTLLSLDRQGLE
ncbi:MAG: Zn-dependent hydrolase [Gemmatimonadetes bacterium]|nr:Zn-dependent hydrolase [Gemmatimonadota bacterium]NNL31221.1 Zn-dependent hydrolase [Gemmatimonadota bacterium]